MPLPDRIGSCAYDQGLKDKGMTKLTVLYRPPLGAGHDDFLKWHTGPHQRPNVQMPDLLKTGFYAFYASGEGSPPYQCITELYCPDQETFEKAFFDENSQARLEESLKRVAGPVSLVSRRVLAQKARGD